MRVIHASAQPGTCWAYDEVFQCLGCRGASGAYKLHLKKKLVIALGTHKCDGSAALLCASIDECGSARASRWEDFGNQTYLYCHSSKRLRSGPHAVSHHSGT